MNDGSVGTSGEEDKRIDLMEIALAKPHPQESQEDSEKIKTGTSNDKIEDEKKSEKKEEEKKEDDKIEEKKDDDKKVEEKQESEKAKGKKPRKLSYSMNSKYAVDEKTRKILEMLGAAGSQDLEDSQEDPMQQNLSCGICSQIFYKCVSLIPCLHNFCSSCYSGWMVSY